MYERLLKPFKIKQKCLLSQNTRRGEKITNGACIERVGRLVLPSVTESHSVNLHVPPIYPLFIEGLRYLKKHCFDLHCFSYNVWIIQE